MVQSSPVVALHSLSRYSHRELQDREQRGHDWTRCSHAVVRIAWKVVLSVNINS